MVCQHGRLQAVCYDCRKNDKFTFAIRAQLEAAQAKLNTQKAYYESVFEDGAKQIKKFKDELAALKEVRDNCTLVPTDKLKAMQGELATLKQAKGADGHEMARKNQCHFQVMTYALEATR